MTAVNQAVKVAALAAVPLSLLATYTLLAALHARLPLEPPLDRLPSPNLSARSGDSDVRLTWSVPSDQLRFIERWEYEQFRAGTVPGRSSTESNAMGHLVTGLTNGVTYSFRVRAIPRTDSGKVAVWSNTVSATPMQEGGDVLERMERHQHGMERHQWSMAQQQEAMAREQGRIADSASVAAAFVAENGEMFGKLADLGVDALERLAVHSESPDSGCTDCPDSNAAQSIHNIHHTTFAVRFAPPWFNADQRSLFTSYVVFPEEAKFEDWISGDPSKMCERDDPPASICPDTTFYKQAMEPFLKGLSQCATTEKVQLRVVGFASSTGLKESLENESEKELLKERYDRRIAEAELCRDKTKENERDNPSAAFNLLIANERADRVAGMLEGLVPREMKSAFAIKDVPWCSHAAMVAKRGPKDGGDPAIGLMNRRAEVHLAALPGCLNIDPDNRIDFTD